MSSTGYLYTTIFIAMIAIYSACMKDKGKPQQPAENNMPACGYQEDVRPFILSKCAVEGCHISGFPFGDFNNYTDLKIRTDNSKVQKFVFELNIMPPSGKEQLSADELQTLKCWLENDAPEN